MKAYKQVDSKELAKKMVEKCWQRFDELKNKPKLTESEFVEFKRLNQTLRILKGQ
jgi:hypothetical protein